MTLGLVLVGSVSVWRRVFTGQDWLLLDVTSFINGFEDCR